MAQGLDHQCPALIGKRQGGQPHRRPQGKAEQVGDDHGRPVPHQVYQRLAQGRSGEAGGEQCFVAQDSQGYPRRAPDEGSDEKPLLLLHGVPPPIILKPV